jgi:hypothetical protein
MSFEAELRLEGNTYRINGLSLDISQEVDDIGRPCSATRGGVIKIEMDALKDEVITDWVMNPNKQLNGTITYYRTDELAKLKEITFENGFCIELREKYLGVAHANRLISLMSISSEKVSIGSVEMNNQWPGSSE